MLRCRLRLVALLALVLLALAAPAAAHIAPSAPIAEAAQPMEDAVVPVLSAAPDLPALPGYLVAALALLVMIAGRRPRTALVVSLVLILSVFAFENALHSVHHGFDPMQQEDCAVAAVSAQLAAVEVADAGSASVALALAGRADVASSPLVLSRVLSPDQGRAPPSAIQ